MSVKINKLIAIIITAIIIGGAFITFATRIVMNSLPKDYTEYNTELIKKESRIFRNDYGIPHITTESEQDLYFMLGYAQAEDRLWQMDYYRRLAKGELSEIFGEKELYYDKFIRAFDLKSLSLKIERNLGPESRIILKSFSDGVNFFIKQNLKKLPVEFSALKYDPYKWEPSDCIAIYKLFSLKNSPGFTNDLILGEISNIFGYEKALSLIGEYPKDAPLVYEVNTYIKAADTTKIDSIKINNTISKTNVIKPKLHTKLDFDDFYDNLNSILPKITLGSGSIGSNAWAVISNKGKNNYAVLANDPHLELSNPPQFYQAKLTCDNYNLTGLVLCGTPIMLIGRNDNISWGITNSMADDFDYFIENIDPKNNDFYLNTDSSSVRFKYIVDTIYIKNQSIYTYYKRYTNNSAVISDYHSNTKIPSNIKPKNNSNSKNYYEKNCITYNWSGNTNYDDIENYYNLSKSKEWSTFLKFARKIYSPSLNYIYSDKKGNIGQVTGGYIPIRNNTINSSFPLNRNSYNKWLSYLKAEELPYVLNPDKKYIASANNKLFMQRYANFSNYWDSPSRAIRLDTLLKVNFRYSFRDAQIMQNDLYSPIAKKITRILLPIIDLNYTKLSLSQKAATERLKKWDFRMMPSFPSAMIFNEFYKNLIANIFLDDLGEKYFQKYLILRSYANNKLLNIIENESNDFIKNHRNNRINDLNTLFLVTFEQSIDSLSAKFKSNNPADWIYGKEHFVQIKHKFAEDKFLYPSFVLESFPVGGNGSTLNNLEYDYRYPYSVIIGSACKFVTDMSQNFIYSSIPGGISGQNYSANYSDQLQLWIFGGYVKINTGRKPTSDFSLSTKITK